MLAVVTDPITKDDGFGRRLSRIDSETGDNVEVLDLAAELVDHPGFVSALGDRVARFASVRHASYVRVRRLDRPSVDRLELVSDHTPGWRLSELLSESTATGIPLDITVVIALLRQLLPAVALYSRHNRDAAIGTLAPERLIVTPQARLVIAEHAFGPALEKLNLGRDRLWRDLRVSMPPCAGLPRANQRADANAIGVIALSLLLGRVLAIDEYPSQVDALVEGAVEFRGGQPAPLSPAFATWLARALQVDVRTAFQTPAEAQLAFESVLASDRAFVTSPTALEEWVATVGGALDGVECEPKPTDTSPPSDERHRHEASDVREVGRPARKLDSPEFQPLESSFLAARSAAKRHCASEAEPLGGLRRSLARSPLFAAAAIILMLLAVIGWLATRPTEGLREGEGELVVTTRASGAAVSVDGKPAGVTPLTISLSSGVHVIEVSAGGGEPRVVPVMIRAGVQTAQYVEVPEALLPVKPPAEKSRKR